MRALLLPLLLLVAGVAPAEAAAPKDDGMQDFVIPVGWNALLNKERKTALVIGEYKQPGRAHSMLTLLNRETEAALMAEIRKLGYTVIRPTPPKNKPNDNKDKAEDAEWIPMQPGWNAVLNKQGMFAVVLSETKGMGRLRWNPKTQPKPEILHRDTEAELLAEIKRLGYKAVRSTSVTTTAKPQEDDDGFADFVIPVGWNALLNMEKRTAAVLGEFKREGRAHSKLTLLHCETEAELLAEIKKLGFTILPPPPNQKK